MTSLNTIALLSIGVILKATALLATATLAAFAARRASASVRHLIWALGLTSALVLPLLSVMLPHWSATVPAAPAAIRTAVNAAPQDQPQITMPPTVIAPAAAPSPQSPQVSIKTASSPATIDAAPSLSLAHTSTATPARPQQTILWPYLIIAAWITGALLVLSRLMRGMAAVRRAERGARLVSNGSMARAAEDAKKAMPTRRHVDVLLASASEPIRVPITWGALCPIILLPAKATQWPRERVKAALLHEMAHIRRWDWAMLVMSRIVCAVYWWNPLAWLAARKMREESETACDDLVVLAGMPAAEYARQLLEVALAARKQGGIALGAVAMAQTPGVEGRLRAVLATGLARRPMTVRRAIVAATIAAVLAGPLAALRLAAKTPAMATVPDAAQLQLHDGFTLRYAVTITDLKTREQQMSEYQQLQKSYQKCLKQDPHWQPIPDEFYGPFSYYQSRRPKVRHLVLTVSAHNGRLLWQSTEGADTFSLVYNGKGTQHFWNGHAGRVEPGLSFASMSACPLPAVGLPYVPLMKQATLSATSGALQTWDAQCPLEDAVITNGEALYWPGQVHVIRDGGVWKVRDIDTLEQRFDFLTHQRFQGLWIASSMRLNKYSTSTKPVPASFSSLEAAHDWTKTHRTQTSSCDYQLLSATEKPVDLATLTQYPSPKPTNTDLTAREAQQAQSIEQLRVTQALQLRYHLQDWAGKNRGLLTHMEQAQPSNLAAAIPVIQSLNSLPFPLWQTDPRAGRPWDGDPRTAPNGELPAFALCYPAQLTFTHLQRSPEAIDKRLRDAFASRHDLPIATSVGTRDTMIVLWASGRITKSASTYQFAGHGKPFRRTTHETEIVRGFFEG
ncbi:hypothetical protein CCAX7_58070 [Capsulimonas corticalis]|uniref:Uncharacterized protein n=1 Tax=Capsulimonas corticalis TaxID=2219043 RepID=A0A402D014_9BACT|nr:M56 family metallopeptidase [Capsulimonas corticalis]BDI33756.1 hypothetical protein CCAX7_58070 [Capsulimonas corticalis]